MFIQEVKTSHVEETCLYAPTVSPTFSKMRQSIAVEFLALMPAGFSGSSWLVDIYNRANDTGWESIGDFSAAIPSWSPVSLTISGPKLTDYIDYEESPDILVRVYTDTEVTDTEQVPTTCFVKHADPCVHVEELD